MEIFDIVLFTLFCYFVGQLILAIIMHKRKMDMKQDISEFLSKAEEQMKQITFLRVEQHGEMFYLYNQVTDEFVCQGKDLDEIKDAYHSRYPGKKALVDEGGELLFKEKANV